MESKAYLAGMPWSAIEDINSFACQKGGYQFGRTSDGYEPARDLWNDSHTTVITVVEVADLCRKCHRLAPFLFLNGNVFANVAKVALSPALKDLPVSEAVSSRSAIGHYVAGTIGKDELLPLLGLKTQ